MYTLDMPIMTDKQKLRLYNKINIKSNNSCWEWKGNYIKDYGILMINGKRLKPHRVMYFLKNGKIPKDLVIDHMCNNKKCCNPAHLQAITNKENILKGVGISVINKNKKFCKHGHKFSKENTIIRKNGNRECKKCRNLIIKNYRHRRKEKCMI